MLDIGRGKKLDDEYQEMFHSTVAKGLFLSKRSRVNIHPTVSVLTARVKSPNETDWKKCVTMIRYLHSTKKWHKM